MTFEKFEEAREKYRELDQIQSIASFFSKGEFNETRDMQIATIKEEKNCGRIFIPDDIRQKISTLLWEEVRKVEEEFAKI